MVRTKERLDRHVRVLFPPSLYERLEQVAEAEDRAAGAVIRRATKLYVEEALEGTGSEGALPWKRGQGA